MSETEEIYDVDAERLTYAVEYLSKKFPKWNHKVCHKRAIAFLQSGGFNVEGGEFDDSVRALQYNVSRRINEKNHKVSRTAFTHMINTMKEFGLKRTGQCMEIAHDLLRIVKIKTI